MCVWCVWVHIGDFETGARHGERSLTENRLFAYPKCYLLSHCTSTMKAFQIKEYAHPKDIKV